MRRNICKSHDFALKIHIKISEYNIYSKRYMEDIWIKKCVIALYFANMFKVTKIAKLKDSQ